MNQGYRIDSKLLLDEGAGGEQYCPMLQTSVHLRLERIDPSRRMRRYYQLSLVPDLFDQICLVREWGRIGRSRRVHSETFQTENEALAALLVLLREKTKRGYCPAQQGATQQARQQKRSRTQYLPPMS
jgi:predicted DNA-binding WGR domain protein